MTPPDSITRRSVIVGGAGALVAASGFRLAQATTAKPNILFILADDLGYADVSCYGRREYKTTNIDQIAADGMRFTQAYANSSVCSPSRTALITGRYQGRLAIGLDEPTGPPPGIGLPPEHPTLPSLLRKAGYSTALIGKWHLGNLPDFGPLKSGYDHFYGIRSGGADYFNYKDLWDEDAKSHDTGYLTERLGDRAVSMIETFAAQPKPFFISLHFTAVHWPWEGPDDQAEADRLAKKPPGGLIDFDGGSQKTYAEMVMSMDGQIGRVLDALKRTGADKNTIIVFTSDNGGERFADTWPFVGKKGELLEGGIRVPGIVRWPERIAPGTVNDQVTMSMDWLPTLLAAAGTRPDRRYPSDGINYLELSLGKSASKPRKILWRYNSLHQEAVRDSNWKYLKILDNSFLFNVVDDPLERANLEDRYPNVFTRLAADWQAWNKTMLAYTDRNSSWTASGSMLADHFGAPGGIVLRPPTP